MAPLDWSPAIHEVHALLLQATVGTVERREGAPSGRLCAGDSQTQVIVILGAQAGLAGSTYSASAITDSPLGCAIHAVNARVQSRPWDG
jgi:hypothetical protein